MNRLQISPNRRFLQREDGSPFFYLGDTAWELFHRLTFEEADFYLQKRAVQGFTVVQAVVIAEMDGLTTPNANGDLPLIDQDPTQPNEAYFAHVDAIVSRANELGIVVALLPTWADKVNKMWGGGPEIFNEANARAYGEFLRNRYREADLIWVLGGDRAVEDDRILGIWRAMAEGLGNDHLRTFHPNGGHGSSEWLHQESWLDFNMIQSGHSERNSDNGAMIEHDYSLEPAKPCMEAESAYEDHPVAWNPSEKGWFTDAEVRRPAYWSVFAGGHGVTYGCHDVWQMWQPERAPVAWARTPWKEALDLPVASQMKHLKSLIMSRPFFERVPAPEMIKSDRGTGERKLGATHDASGTYALVYFPSQVTAAIDLGGGVVRVSWFDPRTGEATLLGHAQDVQEFTPPTEEDWVLVADSLEANYPLPGQTK